VAATPIKKDFIDIAKDCDLSQIVLFKGLSDRLLFLRDREISQMKEFQGKTIDDHIPDHIINRIRQNAIDEIVNHLRYATQGAGLRVKFAIEDASRADFDFLVECLRTFSPYVEDCYLSDTVGVLSPEKSYIWVNDLLQSTTGVNLGVHYHNDLGLALENTLQSVMAGATIVSGTFGGIGERSGNVAIEQVLNGLKVRFGIEVEGINYEAIAPVLDYMEQKGIRPAAPYSQQAQRHESGIHVNSLLVDPKSYAVLPHNTIEILFGKWSGASNFRYLFEKELNHPQPKEQYEKMRSVIKTLAVEQERYFTAEEVVELWKNGIFE
jgi:methanogen homocitrate synthase/benzylmalate synthase